MTSTIYDEQFSSSKYYNKTICIKCIVSGKSISPYGIPKVVKIDCFTKDSEKCNTCVQFKNKNYTILPEHCLKFIDVNARSFSYIIADIFNITCKFKYEILEIQDMERIFILPPAGIERTKIRMAQTAYYLGSGINTNTIYELIGFTTVDPINQTLTHVFTEAKPLKTSIDNFKSTPELHNKLMEEYYIEKPTVDKIYQYLEVLYKSYAHNITKIYNRFDLHLAIDLFFRSVIDFSFGKEYVHKGWLDAIIVGDTRTGKGYVTEKLIEYFGFGEVISAENCTFAGLVGGLQQNKNHWSITWGKIPLNDRGFVVIDEASELEHRDWAKLSRVRSEGIAEIVKIQTQITSAKTRILFLSNPINRTISTYSYGIQALQDIIKTPEDIARFDYCLILSHNEVSIEDINKQRQLVDCLHTKETERSLIMWTWSKKRNEVLFSDKAIEKIYALAICLSKEFTIAIPLIQGENVRIKLAKLALCFASRIYSNKDKGKILFVDTAHVDAAYEFLHRIYDKTVSGYSALSKMQSESEPTTDNYDTIDNYFNSYGTGKPALCKYLLKNNVINAQDLGEYINQPFDVVREIMSKLLKNNAVIKKHYGYVKTPSFNDWLKKKIFKG